MSDAHPAPGERPATDADADRRAASGPGQRSNRRLAIAIIVAVILLPVIGVVSAAIWGDERPEPTELPQGSGGGIGG